MENWHIVFPVHCTDTALDDVAGAEWWRRRWTASGDYPQAITEHLAQAKLEAVNMANRHHVNYAVVPYANPALNTTDWGNGMPPYLVLDGSGITYLAPPVVTGDTRTRITTERYLAAVYWAANQIVDGIMQWMEQDELLQEAVRSIEQPALNPTMTRWEVSCGIAEQRANLAQWLALSWRETPDLDEFSPVTVLLPSRVEAVAS